jgi:hypothetical protein
MISAGLRRLCSENKFVMFNFKKTVNLTKTCQIEKLKLTEKQKRIRT